ncbi:MAG: hypothetical protein LBU32_08445 [Clostridiales bacterium]|jgi:hypothetical protein|nr:hypothetical protein [Clostridiales bacterium]
MEKTAQKKIRRRKWRRNAPFLAVAIIYPALPMFTLFVIFHFVAFNQFPGRQELYRFIGWTLIPAFAFYGFFIELSIVALIMVVIAKRRLMLLSRLGLIALNVVLYYAFFMSYMLAELSRHEIKFS